jgi:hypothetical protein
MRTGIRVFTLISVVVLAMIVPCQGQSYASLLDTVGVDWTQFETVVPQDKKVAILSNSIFRQDRLIDCKSLECFHFLDFDGDGVMDVVFAGQRGESEHFVFWHNTGSGYVRLFGLWGRVTSLQRHTSHDPYSFDLYNYGCCGAQLNFYETYAPTTASGTSYYRITSRLMSTTSLPTELEFLPNPVSVNLPHPCVLRLWPEIFDERWLECDDCDSTCGNWMATYAPGGSGLILATTTDSTGAKWNFVMMNEEAARTPVGYIDFKHGDNSDLEGPIVGWMLASDIERK